MWKCDPAKVKMVCVQEGTILTLPGTIGLGNQWWLCVPLKCFPLQMVWKCPNVQTDPLGSKNQIVVNVLDLHLYWSCSLENSVQMCQPGCRWPREGTSRPLGLGAPSHWWSVGRHHCHSAVLFNEAQCSAARCKAMQLQDREMQRRKNRWEFFYKMQ